MSLSRIFSASLVGLDALLIEVEVDIRSCDKTLLVIVGLPDTVVKESKDRVLAAIKNSGYSLGGMACTVNLAPGHLRKEGALYDLPIAIGILLSLNKISKPTYYGDYLFIGELGLSGELRPVQGALAIAMLARDLGKKGVLLPAQNAREAASVSEIEIIPIHHFKEAIQFLQHPQSIKKEPFSLSEELFQNELPQVDFADIKGQAEVKRAMEIAAAGGHNIVLSGPPGSGKTMIAKALIGIMPELSIGEALETTKIHSIKGLLPENQSLVTQRPFRSPHHTVSYAGLIGGGTVPRPGEVALAHNGILFLDELPEFSRTALEVLRQPLEDRKVTISRAQGNFTFPTDFICVAAMNPCPCGFLGHPEKRCKDTQMQIDRYRNKISGPLWDRLDMHIQVPSLRYQEMIRPGTGDSSQIIRDRVKKARKRQHVRFHALKTNGRMTSREISQFCPLDSACQNILRQAIEVMGISARSCDRLLRVALTIADLAGEPMKSEHLMEAISYRQLH